MITNHTSHVDLINMKLEQLTALLDVSVCDDFPTYSSEVIHRYLWACSVLAHEIKQAFFDLDEQEKVNS